LIYLLPRHAPALHARRRLTQPRRLRVASITLLADGIDVAPKSACQLGSDRLAVFARQVPARDEHAHEGQEEAEARPHLQREIRVVLVDQVARDDGAGQGGDGGEAVHHAGPVAQLLLGQVCGLCGRVCAVEDVCNRRGRTPDDGAGEEAEDDAEADGGGFGACERPGDQDEEGADDLCGAVHVERAHAVGEVGEEHAADGRGAVHDGQEPEGFNGLVGRVGGRDLGADAVAGAVAKGCSPLGEG
jgi:hypothetical protein